MSEPKPDAAARSKTILAANLLAARTAAGLSQQQLGEASGLGRAYIYRVEAAGSNLTLESLAALAAALNLSPSQLLDEDGLPAGSTLAAAEKTQQAVVGSTQPLLADYLAIELPESRAFEAARLIAAHFRQPIALLEPATRVIVVAGIFGGTSAKSD